MTTRPLWRTEGCVIITPSGMRVPMNDAETAEWVVARLNAS